MHLRLVALALPAAAIAISFGCDLTPPEEPEPGSCDTEFPTVADYLASAETSRGTRPPGHPRERPAFESSRSIDPDFSTAIAGGRHGNAALLIAFDTDGTYRWGRTFSHCEYDEIESVGLFEDGGIAVTTTFRDGDTMRTQLLGLSPEGEPEWTVELCTSPTAFDQHHAVLAIDHSDENVVVAATCGDDQLHMRRVDRDGNTFIEVELSPEQLGGVDPHSLTDLAVHRFPGDSASEIMLGFRGAAVQLNALFGHEWTWVPSETLPEGSVEVAVCPGDGRFYVATSGVEYFSGEHWIRQFGRTGAENWGTRVATPYGGPQGVLRGERFNLRCNEQDIPELVMVRSTGGAEFPEHLVAASFLHDGAVHFSYGGTLPDGAHVGTAGVGASHPVLLVSRDGKWHIDPPADLGWARVP